MDIGIPSIVRGFVARGAKRRDCVRGGESCAPHGGIFEGGEGSESLFCAGTVEEDGERRGTGGVQFSLLLYYYFSIGAVPAFPLLGGFFVIRRCGGGVEEYFLKEPAVERGEQRAQVCFSGIDGEVGEEERAGVEGAGGFRRVSADVEVVCGGDLEGGCGRERQRENEVVGCNASGDFG